MSFVLSWIGGEFPGRSLLSHVFFPSPFDFLCYPARVQRHFLSCWWISFWWNKGCQLPFIPLDNISPWFRFFVHWHVIGRGGLRWGPEGKDIHGTNPISRTLIQPFLCRWLGSLPLWESIESKTMDKSFNFSYCCLTLGLDSFSFLVWSWHVSRSYIPYSKQEPILSNQRAPVVIFVCVWGGPFLVNCLILGMGGDFTLHGIRKA